MSEARQVFKALLRAIDRNITSVTGNKQWREFAIAEFRKGAQERDPAVREQRLQQARDYTFLIESVREHRELLLSYNIGVPVEKREKDMNQRAAHLVGLRMPTLPDGEQPQQGP